MMLKVMQIYAFVPKMPKFYAKNWKKVLNLYKFKITFALYLIRGAKTCYLLLET